MGGREERAHLGAASRRRAGRARRGGRRRSGSPCRSGCDRPTCGAGRGSPPARAPPSRCAPSPTTRRHRARRRCGSSRRAAPSRCTPARRRRGSPSSVRPASWQSRLPSANASQWSPSMPAWNRCPSSASRRRRVRRRRVRRCSGRCASATPSCSSPAWRSRTSATWLQATAQVLLVAEPRRQRGGARHRHRLPVPPDAVDRAVGRRLVRPVRPAPADDHHPGRDGCAGHRPRRARPDGRRDDPHRLRDVAGARDHRRDRQPGASAGSPPSSSNGDTSRT